MTEELLNYFQGDDLPATTWLNKYAKRDETTGEVVETTPDDMHRRMAKEFARIEGQYAQSSSHEHTTYYKVRKPLTEERIYQLFKNFKYVVPAGSVMAGLGINKPVSLSNCFVLPSPEDSYISMMLTRTNQVIVMKHRGGAGYDISNLRPRGAKVNNAAITSTGAASFMDVCSDVTNEVAQQGRRGALMLSMNISHPDVEEFIEKKQDLSKVTGANVSVQVTDEFMRAVQNDEDYILRWPVNAYADPKFYEDKEYNKLYETSLPIHEFSSVLKHGYIKKVRARDVWNKIIHCAWNTAEPGVIFKDRMDKFSPDGVYDKYRGVSTNPCGEIYMSGCESCRLLAINMLSFVENPFTDKAELDIDTVYNVTYEAARLADDLVDLENEAVQRLIDISRSEPLAQDLWGKILEKGESGRRVGLEFTAMADMVAALGKKFCTEEGNKVVKNVCRLMMAAAMDCQVDMAIERGHFPDWNKEIEKDNEWYDFMREEYPERYKLMEKHGRRNISFTTAGPTGSLSLLTRTSSGVEPVFMPVFVRRRKCTSPDDPVDYVDKKGISFSEFVVIHQQLKEWAKVNYPELTEDIETNSLSADRWRELYEKSPWFGACAQDIDWGKRVELQGIVQKYLVTHSISSTVNLPNDVTEEEVSNIYLNAWKNGLKGITVYRDGSREGIMIQREERKKDDKFESYIDAPKRPKSLEADFYTTKVKGVTFYVMVGLYKNRPYEIFVYRTGDDNMKSIKNHKGTITKIKKGVYRYESDLITIENINVHLGTEERMTAKYTSMLMRHAAPLYCIIDTALSVDDNIASFTAAMTRIMRKYLKPEVIKGEVCPDCGGKLIRENGCIHCMDCGWSRCE